MIIMILMTIRIIKEMCILFKWQMVYNLFDIMIEHFTPQVAQGRQKPEKY